MSLLSSPASLNPVRVVQQEYDGRNQREEKAEEER